VAIVPHGIVRDGKVWDIVVSRKAPTHLIPVWLRHFDLETRKEEKRLLCQISNSRFGWTVIVAGDVKGPRLVDGFKSRWKAFEYAIKVSVEWSREEPQ